MGVLFDVLKSGVGSVSGVANDQWLDIVTAGKFSERMAVAPGILKFDSRGRGIKNKGTVGIISNGSSIYIPENTAAFIFSEDGIENVITESGEYIYENGEVSLLNGDNFKEVFAEVKDRFKHGGIARYEKNIAFVNLREIRGIKFGTKTPIPYYDASYNVDLQVRSYGSFSIQITDPEKFIRYYVPAKVTMYNFDDKDSRGQIKGEFLQSYIVALNSLSSENIRVSQITSKANEIENTVISDSTNAGSWEERFGFKLVHIGIEGVGMTEESQKLVKEFNSKRMDVDAYKESSSKAANIASQQKVAEGIKNNGFGDGGGFVMGMNMANQTMSNSSVNVLEQNNDQNQNQTNNLNSIDQQIETINKLKSLLDQGILTEDEFNSKKKQILGL